MANRYASGVGTKKKLQERLKKYKCISSGPPPVFAVELREELKSEDAKYAKVYFGDESHGNIKKVIMIVGATGSGKTTLINGMVNYIFGVEWDDRQRFQLIVEDQLKHSKDHSKSQTTDITCYTLHYQEGYTVPYTVTVIDTPGFGDTAGIERDKEIMGQIRAFFNAGGHHGIDQMDAIGFVAQSGQPRLTAPQKYIFESILSLFGNDVEKNIFMLLTFADAKKPKVLSGIKAASMPYKAFFKFNNDDGSSEDSDSGGESEEKDQMNKMNWEMSARNFCSFFDEIGKVDPKSLTLTKDVLNERECLELTIAGLKTDIDWAMTKLQALIKEIKMLDEFKTESDSAKKTMKTMVTVNKSRIEKLEKGERSLCCQSCNRTCQYPCTRAKLERWCTVMKGVLKVKCSVCDCSVKEHYFQTYRIVWETVEEERTKEDVLKRYQAADGKKVTAELAVQKMVPELAALHKTVLSNAQKVRESLKRLDEIALRPNAKSMVEYLDFLIQTEEDHNRVVHLKALKEQELRLAEMGAKNFDPFKDFRKTIADFGLKLGAECLNELHHLGIDI